MKMMKWNFTNYPYSCIISIKVIIIIIKNNNNKNNNNNNNNNNNKHDVCDFSNSLVKKKNIIKKNLFIEIKYWCSFFILFVKHVPPFF